TSTDTLTVSPVSDMTFSVTVESAGAQKISDRVHTGRWSRLGSSISARKSSTKPSPMSLIEWGPMSRWSFTVALLAVVQSVASVGVATGSSLRPRVGSAVVIIVYLSVCGDGRAVIG